MAITSSDVRVLYKSLLRYSQKLVFTDRDFYLNRIRKELKDNKSLTKPEDIEYYYQVKSKSFISTSLLIFCFFFFRKELLFSKTQDSFNDLIFFFAKLI